MSQESSTQAAVAEAEERLHEAEEAHASQHEIDQLGEHLEEANHPDDRSYVGIAIILGILTAIEVGTYWPFGEFFESNRTLMVIVLSVLMITKFFIVIGYFMHLKFDRRAYSFLFGFGLTLALAVFFVVLFAMNLF